MGAVDVDVAGTVRTPVPSSRACGGTPTSCVWFRASPCRRRARFPQALQLRQEGGGTWEARGPGAKV